MKRRVGVRLDRRKEALAGLVLVAPNTIGLLLLYIGPIIASFVLSFFSWPLLGDLKFAGLNNFVTSFGDPKFRHALVNTFTYASVVMPSVVFGAIMIAWLIESATAGKEAFASLYRVLMFLPVLTMPIAVTLVWKGGILNTNNGVLNTVLTQLFNFESKLKWLSDPDLILWSLIMLGVWSRVGYHVIIAYAGLKNISPSYYESARLEGAGNIAIFFRITLPLLTPIIFLMLIIETIVSMQLFDQVFIFIGSGGSLTTEGINSARTVVYTLYENAFRFFELGLGASQAFVLFVIILSFTIIQFIVQRKWVYYE